ncbi:MAG: hypothetical protein IT535_04135 [Bauldia sp.]|nr:hypothetical protein [Bauldia sp.]
MSRFLNAGLIVAMIGGAGLTYNSKHEVEGASAAVADLRVELAQEKDALSLLKAEWSVLTQPARLQELVTLYAAELGLEPFAPAQLVAIDDIPIRPVVFGPSGTTTAMSGRSIDSIITGSTP